MNSTCFNYDESLKRLGDDQELFRAMARCFVEDAEGLLNEIAEGNERQETRRVERAAHSLKGLAATFSAPAVVTRAQSVEEAGRQANLTRARALLPELVQETRRLRQELLPFATQDPEVPANS